MIHKITQNRGQNKINLFIFYAEVKLNFLPEGEKVNASRRQCKRKTIFFFSLLSRSLTSCPKGKKLMHELLSESEKTESRDLSSDSETH